jgi:chromatin segregation and condensation protein Rec8/ScpA/Scc1 (kleisin family)
VLALASRPREEDMVAPSERYSVEERTAEIEAIVAEHEQVTFTELLGATPTLGWAVVTFIALLDLYRRSVIDLEQSALFADILIKGMKRA